MYEYKFVKMELSTKVRHLKTWREPKDNYQEVIHNHGKEGWRLV